MLGLSAGLSAGLGSSDWGSFLSFSACSFLPSSPPRVTLRVVFEVSVNDAGGRDLIAISAGSLPLKVVVSAAAFSALEGRAPNIFSSSMTSGTAFDFPSKSLIFFMSACRPRKMATARTSAAPAAPPMADPSMAVSSSSLELPSSSPLAVVGDNVGTVVGRDVGAGEGVEVGWKLGAGVGAGLGVAVGGYVYSITVTEMLSVMDAKADAVDVTSTEMFFTDTFKLEATEVKVFKKLEFEVVFSAVLSSLVRDDTKPEAKELAAEVEEFVVDE